MEDNKEEVMECVSDKVYPNLWNLIEHDIVNEIINDATIKIHNIISSETSSTMDIIKRQLLNEFIR